MTCQCAIVDSGHDLGLQTVSKKWSKYIGMSMHWWRFHHEEPGAAGMRVSFTFP